jgi:hypothetical protein
MRTRFADPVLAAIDEVMLRLHARTPVDLETWDVAHEAPLFRRTLRRRLRWEVVC